MTILNPPLRNPRNQNRVMLTRTGHAQNRIDTPDTIPAPTEFTPDGIPKTSAASVIVVDANNGRILYEKNADQVRPAASTQKLLTALIVAETGFLDRPVTVQSGRYIVRAGEAGNQARRDLSANGSFARVAGEKSQ